MRTLGSTIGCDMMLSPKAATAMVSAQMVSLASVKFLSNIKRVRPLKARVSTMRSERGMEMWVMASQRAKASGPTSAIPSGRVSAVIASQR